MKRCFTDDSGRDWLVAINVTTVKRVRALCDVDLMAILDESGALLARFVDDPALLADVLYVACQAQADERDVSDEQFGELLAGDTLQKATDAFLEALVDFFPQETRRKALRRLIEKINKVQGIALNMAVTQLEDPELDKRMEEAVAKVLTPGGSLTDAPESSDSTPGLSLSPS